MRKLILLLTILSLTFSSCKKDEASTDTEATKFLGEWEIVCNGTLDIKGDDLDFNDEPGVVKIYQGDKSDEIIMFVQLDMVTKSVPMTVEAKGEVDGLEYEMDDENQKIFYEIDGLGAIEFNYKVSAEGELNDDMDELETVVTFTGDLSGKITCVGEK